MNKRILIIASEFNKFITDKLVTGARDTCLQQGILPQHLDLVWVPGAFELPTAASKAAATKKWDAIITLGCVIKGETPHFDFICSAVAHKLADLGVEHRLPVIFGVLTTLNVEQALARSSMDKTTEVVGSQSKDKHSNKGAEAAEAALGMITALQQLGEAF
jgi:6,7-dimethyl-8-ribityllumazine synthase